jgi:hypothetical protein
MNNEFLEYCLDYYGKDGRAIHKREHSFSVEEIKAADMILTLFLHRIDVNYFYDTFGRELIRDVCIWRRGIEVFIEYQYFIDQMMALMDIRSVSSSRLRNLATFC